MNDEQKAEFCKEALIPEGVSLELENFEEFYEKRKVLLTSKILAYSRISDFLRVKSTRSP